MAAETNRPAISVMPSLRLTDMSDRSENRSDSSEDRSDGSEDMSEETSLSLATAGETHTCSQMPPSAIRFL